MEDASWPTPSLLKKVKETVTSLSGSNEEVRIALVPYRVCPLGAHIDHQGGSVVAMAIDKGIIFGFVPSRSPQMLVHSEQFPDPVMFRIDEIGNKQQGHLDWGDYAKGAIFALQKKGYKIYQGLTGYINGSKGFHGTGLSSSAAVGIAFLLALEHVNGLCVSEVENIELDKIIENQYLGLRNGILDQSAILLSKQGCLTVIHCKDHNFEVIPPPTHFIGKTQKYKILLAFSGLQHALTSGKSYNLRVTECQEAAKKLLRSCNKELHEPLLCNVTSEEYLEHENKLDGISAKRARHYFTESSRVSQGIHAWSTGNLELFGKLMSESGKSSIDNYECGCEPMKDLLGILLKAPGVFGGRFSGAGFRGCCVALVDADLAGEAVVYVRRMYREVQPQLAKQLETGTAIAICETGDNARIL